MVVLVASAFAMQAQQVKDVELKRQGEWMSVKMLINMAETSPRSNETVVLTPELRNGNNSQALKPVGVYSYNQWYYYERKGVKAGGADEVSFRRGKTPNVVTYETMVPYRSWMNGAELFLRRDSKGCCGGEKGKTAEKYLALFQDESSADTVYIDRPVVVEVVKEVVKEVVTEKESRRRSINGQAFVDFPVNSTQIDPDYHSNTAELGRLRASIDSVRNHPDCEIQKIWIKGYASPEGRWESNSRLAKGRTLAIRDYVVSLYRIPGDLMEVEFEAENWEGLRAFVATSSLPHRAEILEIIDSDREPDTKEWMIKSRYSEDWKTLLAKCLPYLRRTDYRIDYEIKENINN